MDKIFKALSDKNRRKILTLLNKKDMTVNKLLSYFNNIGQSTLSNHLSILKKVDLVNFTINGKERIYRINKELLIAFAENMRRFIGKIDNNFLKDIEIRERKV